VSDLGQLTQSLARTLKRRRAELGFTLDALAARSGVSRGMIIQIEQARSNPSLGTTVKLADALGVSLATLLDQEQGPQVRVVPQEKAVRMWSTPAGSRTTLLVGAETRGPLELWDWVIMPGEGSTSDPHPSGSRELVHVTAGELALEVDGTVYAVPAGASATFEANVPHAYRNNGAVPVEMVMSVSIPPVG
jgi:transcriptional regulator with XRE-family HTH domain